MQLTFLHGYPDYVGKRLIFAGYGSGPASYLATGDPVVLPRYGNYIDIIFSALSVSGNYQVTAQPSSFGARATWSLLWSGIAGGVASVTAAAAGVGTGMTPGTYIINATGGTGGTGGQIQVVVTSAAQVGAITVLSGGKGYTVAPTFSNVALGGTPPALTAVLTTAGPVASGTNLSAEVVQLGGFGGVY